MSQENYYIAPPDKIFDEIKEKSIEIWQTYDDTFKYVTGKLDLIKDIFDKITMMGKEQ
jgi:hypothetical protein